MKTSAAAKKMAIHDLAELDKWLSGKTSGFKKMPVEPVSREQVKAVRQLVHMTQAKFAAVLGVNPITIRFWENGQRNPDGMARKVIRLLKIRPELVNDLAKV
jgi:putative transcriptional regulator